MICAIDIGNTALKVAWFESVELRRFERREGLSPTAAMDWLDAELATQPAERIAVACVVPSWREPLGRLAQRGSLGVVGESSLRTRTRSHATLKGLGADRWMAAEAAYEAERAALVIALGTATTFTAVDCTGTIMGGAIAPGLGTGAGALSKAGAQLFAVPVEVPARAVGGETATAIQSGLVFGHAALVEGMVARIEREWGSPLAVWVTGGWSQVLRPLLPARFTFDPHLVLRGLARATERTWGTAKAAP